LRAEAEEAERRFGRLGARERLATASRERVLEATPAEVWRVVGDPHHMPRWWPSCKRMEGVEEGAFTQVFETKRGRTVRMDFRVLESEPPSRLVFEQELADTPFAGFLGESVTEISLQAEGAQTRVVLAQRHKLRGYSRTGSVLFRRAAGEKLGQALDGLEEAMGLADSGS
jgi:uncharacterized protein YndB with AHSA1/START domain